MADENDETPAEKPAPKTSSMRCLTLALSGCTIIDPDVEIASELIADDAGETPPTTDQDNGR